MKKKRIEEVKKGLEKDIYKKSKQIKDIEKTEILNASTETLGDFLPPQKDPTDTLKIINQEEVDLEINQEEILEKYDKYIYKTKVDNSVEKNEDMEIDILKNKTINDLEESVKVKDLNDIDGTDELELDTTAELPKIEKRKKNNYNNDTIDDTPPSKSSIKLFDKILILLIVILIIAIVIALI